MRTPETLRSLLADPRRRTLAIVVALIVLVAGTVALTASVDAAIARGREDAARQRAILEVARARVADIDRLARSAVPARPLPLDAAIERTLREHAIAFRRMGDARSPATVVIDAVPFETLVAALDALAREQGVRAAEASVTARVEPGVVRAELLLTRE